MNDALSEHSAFIRGVLPGVSRTFALGISLLNDPLRDQIGLAYLLCRVLDTLEDATGLDANARLALLEQAAIELAALAAEPDSPQVADKIRSLGRDIDALFATSTDDRADIKLCQQSSLVFDAVLALPSASKRVAATSASVMARGMASSIASPSVKLATEADLDQYCYYVAGTVGEMLTGLFATERKIPAPSNAWMTRHSIDFGLGLQMTNVIKDVTEDFARGVVYLPQSVLRVSGTDIETLISDPKGPAARAVVRRIAGRALGCLDAAYGYTLAVPARESDIRVLCALPLLLAMRTLGRAISELSSFETGRAPKVSRLEVGELQAAVEAASSSDANLGALIRTERRDLLNALNTATGQDFPTDIGGTGVPKLAYVALGTNVGDLNANADQALAGIAAIEGVRVIRESKRISTAPVDCPADSGTFLNSVVEVSTHLEAGALLAALLGVERSMGRIRTQVTNEPRRIDLDLVLIDGAVTGWTGDQVPEKGDEVVVPHPRLHQRSFVLEPLLDLVPEAIHPNFNKPLVAFLDDSR